MADALTLRETAARLGVSETKVWQLLREGKLTARVNELDRRERLIAVAEIEAFEQANRRPRRSVIDQELRHIPRGDIHQNLFRAAYNALREHQLAQDSSAPAIEAIREAAQLVQNTYPEFQPEYDRQFFERSAGGEP